MASQKIEEMKKAYKSGGADAARAVGEAYDSGKTTTTTTTPTATTTTATTPKNTTTTTTAKPEYAGQGSAAAIQPKDTSWDTGNGQYTYNPQSGYYESNQTKTTTPVSNGKTDFATTWNNYSYEKQQELLNKTPNLKTYLANKGLTVKQPGETTVKEETPKGEKTTTPKSGDGWDYQDNSPERMMEMANNLEKMWVSDPGLFTNEETFRNFFINGKGRTPEQEAFLLDYYKNRQTYNKYDGITAENAGNLLANGQLPQSYLNYVKNSNPDRYDAIMDAKDRAEDQIRANASLDTVNTMTGEDSTFQSKFLQWAKENGLLVDKDGNLVDDRMENYASDEEKTYQKKISDLYADILDIDNTVKHTYEDLVDRYPGASKATLMAMAQDTNSDLLREKENMTVELTRLQGYVGYMQAERQEMNTAGQNTIANLQKELGMYYSYSPEGLSELAQAQYAATNITLDQADNGTDTQKQMALQSVLDDYYEKYGSIIQRSEQQVINDVMALAKKKGISLSQALQENFITPLQNKAEYRQLNTDTSGIQWTKIGEDADGNAVYGFIDLYNQTVTPYGNLASQGVADTYDISTRQGKQKTISQIVSYDGTDDLGGIVSDIYNSLKGTDYGECGYLVNDYYKAITGDTNNLVTGTFKDRKDLFTKNYASDGDIILFDWTNSPTASDKQKTYGHVGIVESTDATGIWVVDANWDGKGTVDRRHIDYDSDLYQNRVYGFYEIPQSKRKAGEGALINMGYIDTPDAIAAYEEFNKLGKSGLDTKAKQDRAKDLFKSLGVTENEFKIMANAYWDYQNAQQAQANIEMIDKLINDIDELPELRTRNRLGTPNSYGSWRGQENGSRGFAGNAYLEYLDDEELSQYNKWASDYDQLMANLMYDKYQDIKSTGGTFGSMSNAEWDNLKQAATNLKYNQDKDTYLYNLKKLKEQFQNLESYGGGKQSTTSELSGNSGYKLNTKNSLMSKFTSY